MSREKMREALNNLLMKDRAAARAADTQLPVVTQQRIYEGRDAALEEFLDTLSSFVKEEAHK